MKEFLLGLATGLVFMGMMWLVVNQRKECEAKGGVLIHSTCVKAVVIE